LGRERDARSADDDDADRPAACRAVAALDADLARSRLVAERHVELRAADQLVRDAIEDGLGVAAARVAGVVVDRDRRRVRRRGALVHREGVPHRSLDARQAAEPDDADPLGPPGLTLRKKLVSDTLFPEIGA